ncbi:MAG: hypothetical protein NVS4B3_05620 [Gemmatimonadaceae bacterium]
MSQPGPKKGPVPVSVVLREFLRESGLGERVEQASVVPEWAALVGEQIGAVTTPLSVTADGTLFVAVATNGWMTELSLLEPELLKSLNGKPGRAPVRRIRWQIRRMP